MIPVIKRQTRAHLRTFCAVMLMVVTTNLFRSSPAEASPDNDINKTKILASWSNTIVHLNPPADWLQAAWQGLTIFVPPDAIVTASNKVLQVSIPVTDGELRTLFRVGAVPKGVPVTRDGALQLTHGSTTVIDRTDLGDEFEPHHQLPPDGNPVVTFEAGSGVGAWRNRPAYIRHDGDSRFMSVLLATAVKRQGRVMLASASTGGTPAAYSQRGSDAWLVMNTLLFGDSLRPKCRYPDGRACFGGAGGPKWFPSALMKRVGVGQAQPLTMDTRNQKVRRPSTVIGSLAEFGVVTNSWNMIGGFLPPGTYVGSGNNCSVSITDKNYATVLSIDPVGGYAQILASVKSGERIKSNCELHPGAGQEGDDRTVPGYHSGIRPGLFITPTPCTEIPTEGTELLRGGQGKAVAMTNPSSPFRITSSVVRLPQQCSGLTRTGD